MSTFSRPLKGCGKRTQLLEIISRRVLIETRRGTIVESKSSHFEVGDFVYYYVPKNHYGTNRKSVMDNRSPYRVERRVNQVNYVIRRSPTAAPVIVYIDRLSRYITDQIPPVWRTRITAQVPRSAVETQPKTAVSDGSTVSMDVCDHSSTARIPGMALLSSPPTTAVTVGSIDARPRNVSTRGDNGEVSGTSSADRS